MGFKPIQKWYTFMKIFFKGCSVHCSTYKNHLKIFVRAPTMPFFVPKYGHFWQKFAKRIIFLFFQEKGQRFHFPPSGKVKQNLTPPQKNSPPPQKKTRPRNPWHVGPFTSEPPPGTPGPPGHQDYQGHQGHKKQ